MFSKKVFKSRSVWAMQLYCSWFFLECELLPIDFWSSGVSRLPHFEISNHLKKNPQKQVFCCVNSNLKCNRQRELFFIESNQARKKIVEKPWQFVKWLYYSVNLVSFFKAGDCEIWIIARVLTWLNTILPQSHLSINSWIFHSQFYKLVLWSFPM